MHVAIVILSLDSSQVVVVEALSKNCHSTVVGL